MIFQINKKFPNLHLTRPSPFRQAILMPTAIPQECFLPTVIEICFLYMVVLLKLLKEQINMTIDIHMYMYRRCVRIRYCTKYLSSHFL